MIEALVKQFLGSGEASSVLGQLQQQGLNPTEAQGAVTATAEGAAEAAKSGGLAGLLGGGGLAGALGGLGGLLGGTGGSGGGGGLGGLLGGLGGLGGLTGGGDAGASPGGTAGIPAQIVDTIAQLVASKTGLSLEKAKSAVSVVLPKVIEFVKSKMG